MSFHLLLLNYISMCSGIWISIINYKVSYILTLHAHTASSESHLHVFLILNFLHSWIICIYIPPACDFMYYWILFIFSESCLLCCLIIKTKNETLNILLAFTTAIQYMLINISYFSLNMLHIFMTSFVKLHVTLENLIVTTLHILCITPHLLCLKLWSFLCTSALG
jgi:hypothetical protein